MALKVELKPHERIIIGACVITNTDQRARLLFDGEKIPILREKDILTRTPPIHRPNLSIWRCS
jgi:flagellar biosynthesis repressor protein FlbT